MFGHIVDSQLSLSRQLSGRAKFASNKTGANEQREIGERLLPILFRFFFLLAPVSPRCALDYQKGTATSLAIFLLYRFVNPNYLNKDVWIELSIF